MRRDNASAFAVTVVGAMCICILLMLLSSCATCKPRVETIEVKVPVAVSPPPIPIPERPEWRVPLLGRGSEEEDEGASEEESFSTLEGIRAITQDLMNALKHIEYLEYIMEQYNEAIGTVPD